MTDLTGPQREALDIARQLADVGVPVFVVHPDSSQTTGYRLPKGWQTTPARPDWVKAWRPGLGLCAVMGHTIDLVDCDDRNGFDSTTLDGLMPKVYAVAATPSGGWHGFVRTLGVGSRDNVLPGVDIKAGDPDGNGRGFAFIAPTVRASKITGELVAYRWERAPDFDALKNSSDDQSGVALADLVRKARGGTRHDADGETGPKPWDDIPGLLARESRHDAVYKLACALRGRGGWRHGDALAYMDAVVWPEVQKVVKDHEYTRAEYEGDIKDAFTRHEDGPSESITITEPTVIEPTPVTLDDCHATFRRWLGAEYDLDVLDIALCALAAERLGGDPLWLLVISGPGAAKTETVQAARGAGALIESTITGEAALLSGTPKKERAKTATGGLLRVLGESGVLVIKDFTSIISMSRDRRAEVLAALREVYDGYWSRSIGAEGGRTLTWSGRLAVIGAVTTAWDSAHSVVSAMGDRFVSVRLDSTAGRVTAFRQTMANTGDETTMRAELAAVVGGVIAGLEVDAELSLTEEEIERLGAAANLVTLARTGVEYDYKGDVIDAHAPEMPTRFARQLQQIIRGALALGIDRHQALRLAIRAARDTMPPIRLAIVDDVAARPHSTPADIRRRVDLPWRTVDRQCQALHMLGVLACDEEPYGDSGRSRWYYTLADGIDPSALERPPDLATPPPRPPRREGTEGNHQEPPRAGPANTGAHSQQVSTHTCRLCGDELTPERAAVNTCCERCDVLIRGSQPPLSEQASA